MAALLPAAPADAVRADNLGGFSVIEASAQGQAGTGYFYAVGDEENRLIGALSQINGPPAGSRNLAGFIQPGVAADFAYGSLGGGSAGKNGALPQPMPGLANGFFPADPPESTVQGPLSTGAGNKPVDGRYYAKATPTPTGLAEAAVTDYDGAAFTVQDASVVSRTEPTEAGLLAETTTVLRGLTIGPLRIEQMVSHAKGLLSSTDAESVATAVTTIYGATVNGIGVKITEEGIAVSDQKVPGAQKQVNDALSQGNMSFSLARSVVTTAEDKVTASAGGLRVVYQDPALAQQNSQGFSGGGFSAGGADVSAFGRRAS